MMINFWNGCQDLHYVACMQAFPKPIEMAKQWVKQVVESGDSVLDATLGNGHDTLLLAQLVGASGKVYGFDVQQEAVDSSQKRMQENGITEEVVSFHCIGHQYLSEHVNDEVSAVMFNLGYLPRADKAVITTRETTIPALEQALEILRVGGLITVMCYPGHEGGDVEAAAVRKWASTLPREQMRVVEYGLLNAPNSPPFLIGIEKIKAS